MRLLGYCLMPNHWHLVLWPRHDGDLGRFMQRLTVTHVRRWHEHRHSTGGGHVYQGIYKSFPVQSDAHLLTCCATWKATPAAGLVKRAERWPWSSVAGREAAQQMLSEWPVERPRNWVDIVNEIPERRSRK